MFRLLLSFVILSYLLSCKQAENPLETLLSDKNLQKASIPDGVELIPGEEGRSIELKFPASDVRLSVKIPLPDGPQDWNDIGTFSFYSKAILRSVIISPFTIRQKNGSDTASILI